MPSSATITAFYTFVADTKARASEANNNFSMFRGHIIPIEPLTATSADITYDLGSREHSWRVGYVQSLQLRGATSTVDPIFKGITSVTAGAAEMLFGTTTISTYSINGMTRQSLESAANSMTTTANHTNVLAVTATSAYVNVTNMSITITIKKGPIEIALYNGDSGGALMIHNTGGATVTAYADFRVARDTVTSIVNNSGHRVGTGGSLYTYFPSSSLRWIDNPGPGTYTYTLQVGSVAYDPIVHFTRIGMRIREL